MQSHSASNWKLAANTSQESREDSDKGAYFVGRITYPVMSPGVRNNGWAEDSSGVRASASERYLDAENHKQMSLLNLIHLNSTV